MQMADLGDIRLHYRIDGPADGAPVGISILAASGGDMMLLGLAREVMRAAVRSANDRRPAGR